MPDNAGAQEALAMPELHGFMFPRCRTGRASLVPPTAVALHGPDADHRVPHRPGRVAELLPDPLEPADDDPGAVAVIWADWQICCDTFEELLDPVRASTWRPSSSIRCKYRGSTTPACVYIWVDRDFALVRG